MRISRRLIAAAAAALLTSSEARADDYLFPARGRFSAALSTGIPFIALGEVAYGIGDGFAVGLLAGTTPIIPGVGLRPRGVLAKTGPIRVDLTVPILYYPPTRSDEAWILVMPTLQVEVVFTRGAVVKIGAGAVGAAYVDWLTSLGRDRGSGRVGGVWDTLEVGGALPLSSKTTLFGEATGVFQGYKPAGREWIGGPPVVIALGVTTAL
jgi:hypothetical protein